MNSIDGAKFIIPTVTLEETQYCPRISLITSIILGLLLFGLIIVVIFLYLKYVKPTCQPYKLITENTETQRTLKYFHGKTE